MTQQDQAHVLPPTRGTESRHEAIAGAVARGWCTPENASKVMDSDLALAIVAEVEAELARRGRAQGGNTSEENGAASVPPLTAPAPLTDEWPTAANVLAENLENIADQWEGCMFDAPGETIDIGNDLRIAFAKLDLSAAKAAPAAPVLPEKAIMLDLMQDLMRFECVLTPEGKAEMYASENGPYVWFDHVTSTIEGAPSVAAPVQTAEPVIFDDFPEFNAQAMGCGLEDRGITDPYDAMRYGFEEALDLVDERIKNFLADFTGPSLAAPVQAEQAQAEPVAWMNPNEGSVMDAFLWLKDAANPQYSQPVYTAIPARAAQAEQAAAVRAAYDLADGLAKFVELVISELFTGKEYKAIRSDLRSLAKNFNPEYWQVSKEAAIQAPSQTDNNNED